MLFNQELLKGTFQDLLVANEEIHKKKARISVLSSVCHNALYKYSHSRLDKFCGITAFAYLFNLFKLKDSHSDVIGTNYEEALMFIFNKCSKKLNASKRDYSSLLDSAEQDEL